MVRRCISLRPGLKMYLRCGCHQDFVIATVGGQGNQSRHGDGAYRNHYKGVCPRPEKVEQNDWENQKRGDQDGQHHTDHRRNSLVIVRVESSPVVVDGRRTTLFVLQRRP